MFPALSFLNSIRIVRRRRRLLSLFAVLTMPVGSGTARAATETSDEVITMEAFNVTVYGGEIRIIDGITGKKYDGDNPIVFDFANSFNKILVTYHKRLVLEEIEHLKLRLKLGEEFEQEMQARAEAFEFKPFKLDRDNWLTRERSIVSRLIKKPFFIIKSLVAWDIDQLNEMAPTKPASKFADDIRFNSETQQWERRMMAEWNVFFQRDPSRPQNAFSTFKQQGLNLDSLRGFHFIERGLPANVPPHAFKEVSLTYPIFYSDQKVTAEELRRLQEAFVANLYFVYDPFSWVARRDTRFRGGFYPECLEHVKKQKIYVSDPQWFEPMLARFLSDITTIKLQDADEIYALHMLTKRLNESPRSLGMGLDLLNWNPRETRQALDEPETVARVYPKSTWGFRYVMIDAYQRFGETLVERIRERLLAQKAARKKTDGQQLVADIIAELSDMPFDDFVKRAVSTQEAHLASHRLTD